MSIIKKTCRVCDKEYKACKPDARDNGVFKWQEVACSVECGARYLKSVTESRSAQTDQKKAQKKEEIPVDNTPVMAEAVKEHPEEYLY